MCKAAGTGDMPVFELTPTTCDESQCHHVKVVCRSFLEIVVRVVDDAYADILVHIKEGGQQHCWKTAKKFCSEWYNVEGNEKCSSP